MYFLFNNAIAIFFILSFYCPRGYKTFSCSNKLSMKIFMLINVKMPTIVGKNSILGLSEPKKAEFLGILYL